MHIQNIMRKIRIWHKKKDKDADTPITQMSILTQRGNSFILMSFESKGQRQLKMHFTLIDSENWSKYISTKHPVWAKCLHRISQNLRIPYKHISAWLVSQSKLHISILRTERETALHLWDLLGPPPTNFIPVTSWTPFECCQISALVLLYSSAKCLWSTSHQIQTLSL